MKKYLLLLVLLPLGCGPSQHTIKAPSLDEAYDVARETCQGAWHQVEVGGAAFPFASYQESEGYTIHVVCK